MNSIGLLLAAAAVTGASGLPGLLFARSSRFGQLAVTGILLAGCALGVTGVATFLGGGLADAASGTAATATLSTPWFLPIGAFAVAVDRLGAVFLLPVFVVPALASVYGLGYWKQSAHADNGRRLGLSLGVLVGAMVLVVLARDAILFLMAWESMALAAWFASTAESEQPSVRRAGWVYLVATHLGTLCLLAMFSLWRSATGSFSLGGAGVLPTAFGVAPGIATAIFALAVVGFGLKAGLMPLHVWLPGAHANAPSHISAVMSGVMLKMGIYGIARMTALLPVADPAWGWSLLGLGALSGLGGIAWALGQGDLKRVLAYSSVENIGIIAMGMGLALLGRATGSPVLALLGMGGALLHVWNHSLFKSLLFFGAGAVVHATGTRKIDLMGGLAKSMPRAAFLFALGSVAISALPPLNGFVGEWLLYLGFFRSLDPFGTPSLAAAAAGAAVLAAIGALALAAFVRAFGGVFLGAPRAKLPLAAHDPPASMLLPMALAALGCLAIGLLPSLVLPLVGEAASEWAGLGEGSATLASLVDTGWFPLAGIAILTVATAFFAAFTLRSRSRARRTAPTWDCGYAEPTMRMQYTPSSFGEFPLRGLAFPLFPKLRKPRVDGAFPAPADFSSTFPDLALDRIILPFARFVNRAVPFFRVIQQGQTQLYLVYVLVVTLILLVAGVGLS
jgi:hydrogenase-4 component B